MSSTSHLGESSMATAAVKEEQEVYICLPVFYVQGKHILSWALSHFPKDETKIIATIITHPPFIIHSLLINYGKGIMWDEFFTLEQHLSQCAIQKFKAEKLIHKNDDQVEGILELIDLRAIKNLVMGFIQNSELLAYVVEKANPSCKIWFIHQGNLQLIRYPKSDLIEAPSDERIRREELPQKEIEETQKILDVSLLKFGGWHEVGTLQGRFALVSFIVYFG